ncbi:MAG: hypothetical protein KGI67_13900 [Pseudomonadota bacterium]|nr:hypothetical protein [Pseudomonadota bacterium]
MVGRAAVCAGLVLMAAPVLAAAGATAAAHPADAAPLASGDARPAAASDDPAAYVQFVLEDDSDCLMREGKHVLVRSAHPSRTIRVWLDRYYRNRGTGDRSRSDLRPGAEGEALGCSHIGDGDQEWRVVRAQFLE